jgi:hypothetical protein
MCPGVSNTHVRKTGAIAWRIFKVGKFLNRTMSLRPIIFIVVETSALYGFGVAAALVSFLCNSNGQYAAVDAIVPLVVSCASHLLTLRRVASPTLRVSSSV